MISYIKRIKKGDLLKAAAAGFLFTVICTVLPFFSKCEDISNNVIRVHILANSDSEEDQEIKLKVRDAVLEESAKIYENCTSAEEANFEICTNMGKIRETVQRVLEAEGAGYSGTVAVTDMYFTNRDYKDFTLPAGKYRALRVSLGEGEGKNWWCMVYPSLCLPAADAEKDKETMEALPDSEAEIITNPEGHRVEFKLVEWFEGIKKLFENKS